MGIKNTSYLLVLGFLLLLSQAIFAQNVNVEQRYNTGKQFFDEAQWGLARQNFEIVFNAEKSSYTPYALFYHALASYNQNFSYLARDGFLKIRNQYPTWKSIDEVNYWLARVYFEIDDYLSALEVLKNIPENAKSPSILSLEPFYIASNSSYDTLKTLYSTYPDDTIISKRLYNVMTKMAPVDLDMDLFMEVGAKYSTEDFSKYIPKDTIEIGVIFPFLSDQLEVDQNSKVNEFILEMYRGIALAADDLSKNGKKINLKLYDTHRNKDSLLYILGKPEMRNLDLIIGPVFFGEIINDYLPVIQVNAVNPLSRNMSLIEENPYHFLFSQLPEEGSLAIGEYVFNTHEKATGWIFYGESKLDSMSAFNFKQKVERDSIKIEVVKRISNSNLNEVIELLMDTRVLNNALLEENEEREFIAGQDSIDFIYVASSDQKGRLYSNVLATVDARLDTIEIFAGRNWLVDGVVDFEILNKLNIKLAGNDHFEISSDKYMQFFTKYLKEFGLKPSKYSAIGYELMHFFGNQVLEFGKYFNYQLKEQGFKNGVLTKGFDYSRSNYNSYMPIIEWDGTSINYIEIPEKKIIEIDEKEE